MLESTMYISLLAGEGQGNVLLTPQNYPHYLKIVSVWSIDFKKIPQNDILYATHG